MPKRIKLPVGRHGGGTVGKSALVTKKNAESAAKERERTEAHRIRSRHATQATVLGRERRRYLDEYAYHDKRRPPGVGHLTNDPLLSEPSKVFEEGAQWNSDPVVMDPFACGTKPVFAEVYDEWRRRKVMVNRSSFPTLHLPWITCGHCLVLIDWGLTCGYLEANERNEVVDPRPDDVERKKLRQRWRRLLRARRATEGEKA